MEVSPCTRESIQCLEQLNQSWADMLHHRERWAWQQQGTAIYLLAWQNGQVVGRTTLLKGSKYDEVRAALPDLWEMNALEARPQGRGVGTLLIKASEQRAAENGVPAFGLAVEPENLGAHRLYQRLGYDEWPQSRVIDEWDEYDELGRLLHTHADDCLYLLKRLIRS
ncbi:MAG: GNAT family N-acetyltransferase [Nocardioidaceae bacterium]